MTPERLRQIAEAATPGPWLAGTRYPECVTFAYRPRDLFHTRTPSAGDAALIALTPDLAWVAAELATAAQEMLDLWDPRSSQSRAPLVEALAAFEQLGEQDDTQAATEVRVSGEESKATKGTGT